MHNVTYKTNRNDNNNNNDNNAYTHPRRVRSHKSHSLQNAEVLLAVGDDQSTLRISRYT